MKRLLILFIIAICVTGVVGYIVYIINYGKSLNQINNYNQYINQEYGFTIKFSESWKGYSVIKSSWTGQVLQWQGTITGPLIIFRNPNWTKERHWQDIPIMIFTRDSWNLVLEKNLAVSAAPVPPLLIGENEKYIFATPPRWYGFTDDIGWQGAVDIVETFKALPYESK